MRFRNKLLPLVIGLLVVVLTGCFQTGSSPVSGVVVYKNGKPVADAVVTIGNQSVRTDDSGAFSFKEVRNGRQTIRVEVDGNVVTQTVNVRKDLAPVTITLNEINWAFRKSYTYNIEPHQDYPDSGGELTDGERGNSFYKNPPWTGHLRNDYREIVIDLGAVRPITMFKTAFLQDTSVGIRLTPYVSFSVSMDGETWEEVADLSLEEFEAPADPYIHHVELSGFDTEGRYVKVYFEVPVWVFLDEIEVWG